MFSVSYVTGSALLIATCPLVIGTASALYLVWTSLVVSLVSDCKCVSVDACCHNTVLSIVFKSKYSVITVSFSDSCGCCMININFASLRYAC